MPRSDRAIPRTLFEGSVGGPATHCAGGGSATGSTGAAAGAPAETPAVTVGIRPEAIHASSASAFIPSKGSGAGISGGVTEAVSRMLSSSSSPSPGSGGASSEATTTGGGDAAKPCVPTSDDAVKSPATRTPTMAHRRMLPTPVRDAAVCSQNHGRVAQRDALRAQKMHRLSLNSLRATASEKRSVPAPQILRPPEIPQQVQTIPSGSRSSSKNLAGIKGKTG